MSDTPLYPFETVALPHVITDDHPVLDHYSRRGVALSRDAAHLAIAALRRDAYEMRERGGDANRRGADAQDALAKSISLSLR